MRNNTVHPLSGRRALESAVNAALQGVPEAAFDELQPWLESLVGNMDLGFVEKAQMLFALDEALQAPARQCTDQYLEADASGMPAEQRRRWKQIQGCWALVLDIYGELLITLAAGAEDVEPELLAQIAVRATRAASNLVKWNALHGDPSGHDIWARLNLAYRLAEQAGVARQAVRLRQDRDLTQTAELEYLRAIALYSLGLEQLDAGSLELASRLVHYVLSRLELSAFPSTVSLYWVDVALAAPPARVLQLPNQTNMPRFFSGAMAVDSLQSLLELASSGNVPPGFILRHAAGAGGLANVLAYMIRRWSGVAPLRRQKRHEMPGAMFVVLGIDEVLASLEGREDPAALRQWTVHDVSRQGIGVDVPQGQGEGTRVGMLVGLRPEDADFWRIGVVRRVRHEGAVHSQLGIELFGEKAVRVVARDGALQLLALLLDPLTPGSTVRLILSGSPVALSLNLFISERGQTFRLTLLPGREFGADHEICTCLVSLA